MNENKSPRKGFDMLAGKRLLLLVGSILVSIAVAEAAARLIGWGDVVAFVPNKDWGFLMKPSQTVYTYGIPVKINSLGLRGPEIRDPKPPGSLRIVFLGDSVTYGGGRIAEDELFCRIVESNARRDGIDAEVVSVSAPAWSPQNWWAHVQKNGLYDADIVVLVLPECDLARRFSTMEMGGHWESAPLLRLESLVRKVLSRFGHDQLTAQRVEVEDVIKLNMAAIDGLRERCGGIPFVTVLVPSGVPGKPDYQLWSRFTSLFPMTVDLREDLQDPSYYFDGAHLTAAGHSFVGKRISEAIRPLWSQKIESGQASSD